MDSNVDLSPIMVGYSGKSSDAQPITTSAPEIPSPIKTEPQLISPPQPSSVPANELVTRIKLYFDIFPAKLKDIRPRKPIDKLSEEELQDLHNQINYHLGAKTQVDGMAKMFPMVLKTVEDLAAEFTPLRIQGTHAVCYDPEVQDLIKYTLIDMGLAGISSTPQQRLVFTLITAAVQRHTINSAIEAMNPAQKEAYFKAMAAATNQATVPAPRPDPAPTPVPTPAATPDPLKRPRGRPPKYPRPVETAKIDDQDNILQTPPTDRYADL